MAGPFFGWLADTDAPPVVTDGHLPVTRPEIPIKAKMERVRMNGRPLSSVALVGTRMKVGISCRRNPAWLFVCAQTSRRLLRPPPTA
jgi:hypothetical protein